MENQDIKSLLLTPEQMADKYNELHDAEYQFPYFYKIGRGSQILFYVGAHHFFDPTNYQLPKIRKYWSEFLNCTNKANSVILVEGGVRPVEENETKAILEGGEASFLTYLADKEGIDCHSPEPDDVNELSLLATQFSIEDICYQRFARTANQWSRLQEPRPDFGLYVSRYLERDKKLMGWDIDVSIEAFGRVHDKSRGHKFSVEGCISNKCFRSDSNPISNKISAASSVYRDVYIMQEILRLWGGGWGKSIFIIYGSGHALVHEPALKALLIQR